MSTIRGLLSIVILSLATLGAFPGIADPAPSPAPAPTTRVIQGEVVKLEGDSCLVKNKKGEEVLLRVDKETLLDSRVKVGDKVDATVLADGRTASIMQALAP